MNPMSPMRAKRAKRAKSGTLSTGAKVAHFLYTYKYNKHFNTL